MDTSVLAAPREPRWGRGAGVIRLTHPPALGFCFAIIGLDNRNMLLE